MSTSIFFKVSQNRTKLQQNKTQPFFLFKINKVFLSPIFQNLFWTKNSWKWSSWQAKKDATKQNVLSFQEVSQKRKIVIKIEFTPLADCNILPFLKWDFKKSKMAI